MRGGRRTDWVRNGTTIIGALTLLLLLPGAAAQSDNNPSRSENPYNMDARLTPSMAIIIVVLIAAMFFMGFFSIYIRNCSGRGGGGSIRAAVAGAVAGLSRRARGLDDETLQTMPTFAYSEVKGLKIGKGALECAVCLNEFADDETLRLLPKCDHVFHAECIDAWFATRTTCPVCRANLDENAAEPVSAAAAEVQETEDRRSETPEVHGDAVIVPVAEDPDRNVDSGSLPPRPPNRPARSWSVKKPRFLSRFPRSHSTGHSLVPPGDNCDRFTLRLPQGVRKQLVNRSMNRAAGLAMLPREDSSRRGPRGGGEGSSRGGRFYRRLDSAGKSDRWAMFTRASSLRTPRSAADGEGASGSAATPRALLAAVRAPLNCIGSKADDAKPASGESARLAEPASGELARLPV